MGTEAEMLPPLVPHPPFRLATSGTWRLAGGRRVSGVIIKVLPTITRRLEAGDLLGLVSGQEPEQEAEEVAAPQRGCPAQARLLHRQRRAQGDQQLHAAPHVMCHVSRVTCHDVSRVVTWT